ncbi:hypothetical protein RJT34_30775 [Clitoria ternatea]|uniref:Spt20-like SEP domain-containing protein n=1 Tax=Clitoria ternatea TaxID=43366 RepID=A0AAN9ET24_CLITE
MCMEAAESGHLPGDILDDIPAKYVDGALICEVHDYRRCFSEKGGSVVSAESFPYANQVCLKISLENIVKDIPSITVKSWTYGDLMEVESKIVKALQPKLHLDPTAKLDRQDMKWKLELGTPRSLQEHGSNSAINSSGASSDTQDVMISYADNANSSSHFEALQGPDMNWPNTTGGGIQKFPQQETGAVLFATSQHSMRLVAKKEQFEMEKLDGPEITAIEVDRNGDRQFRPTTIKASATIATTGIHEINKKRGPASEEEISRVLAYPLGHYLTPHYPENCEFSNGTEGPSFEPSSMAAAPGGSQKEKTAMASVPAAVGIPSNDSTQRQ